jgi:hypothetical protein
MFKIASLGSEWPSNPRGDILAGIVVALALIPEAIGFSTNAGVDPRVGLYASFSIAVIIAVVGGRPGMISAATAAVAVLVVPLVKEHGVEYLFAATILMGVVQIIGTVWIDLNRDGFGIHGTAEPRLIGTTESHGCVRLTNWDAEEFADAVSKGTVVEFV